MIAPERFQEGRRRKRMNGVMHGSVQQVAEHKAGEKAQGIPAHDQVLQAEHNRSQHDAWQGWHKQPFAIARVFVVYPMHGINDIPHPRVFRSKVEYKTMHNVLEKTPEQNPGEEQKRFPAGGKAMIGITVIQ